MKLLRFLWLFLPFSLAYATPWQPVAVTSFSSSPTLTISCASTGSTSSTIACTLAYTGTAPSSATGAWNTTCAGTSTITAFTASLGTGAFTASTPSSACAGTLTVTTNLSTVATSGTVTISGGYVGPGDLTGWTTPYAFYSSFAMTAAIATAGTQPSRRVLNIGSTHQCDLLATATGVGHTLNCSTGGDNGQTYSTFCPTSTACSTIKKYDQSGNGRDKSGAVCIDPPLFSLNGLSGKAADAYTGSTGDTCLKTTTMESGATSPPVTYAIVAERTALDGTNNGLLAGSYSGSGSFVYANGTAANTIGVYAGGAGGMNATATDGSPHAIVAVVQSTTSILNVDGAETADGSNIGSAGFSIEHQNGGDNFISSYLVGYEDEDMMVVGAPTSGQRAAMIANQRARYGF